MSQPSPTVITGIGVSPGRVVAPAVLMPDPIAEPPSGRRLPPGTDYPAEAKRIGAASEVVRAALDAAADRAQGDSADLLHATAAIAADPTLVADAEQRVRRRPAGARSAPSGRPPRRSPRSSRRSAATSPSARATSRTCATGSSRSSPAGPRRACPHTRHPFVLVAADLAPADHRDARHRRACSPIVTGARRPHLAHRDPGALPRHPRRRRGARCRGGRGGRRASCPRRRRRGDGDRRPHGRAGRRRRWRSPRRSARSTGTGAPPTATTSSCWRTSATRPTRRRPPPRGPRASGCSGPSSGSSTATRRPSIDEQVTAYRRVLAAFPGRKVVVRTLDAGADKPLPFLAGDRGGQPRPGGPRPAHRRARTPRCSRTSWRRSPRPPPPRPPRSG